VSVSVSEFVFVFEGGSGLAVFRLAWAESVGSRALSQSSGQPTEHGAAPAD